MTKVIYEPHPVTAERRQELIEQGYKIIDARFAPDGYVHPAPAAEGAGQASKGASKSKAK